LLSIYFLKEDIIGNGAIFNSVSKNELEDFKAMYPPIDLIVQFTEIVKPMDDQIEILIKQNKNLTKTRNLLLPRLISGKLSLKQSEATLNL